MLYCISVWGSTEQVHSSSVFTAQCSSWTCPLKKTLHQISQAFVKCQINVMRPHCSHMRTSHLITNTNTHNFNANPSLYTHISNNPNVKWHNCLFVIVCCIHLKLVIKWVFLLKGWQWIKAKAIIVLGKINPCACLVPTLVDCSAVRLFRIQNKRIYQSNVRVCVNVSAQAESRLLLRAKRVFIHLPCTVFIRCRQFLVGRGAVHNVQLSPARRLD